VLGDLHDAQVFGVEISKLALDATRDAPNAAAIGGGTNGIEPVNGGDRAHRHAASGRRPSHSGTCPESAAATVAQAIEVPSRLPEQTVLAAPRLTPT
jgi:hypothetical protein